MDKKQKTSVSFYSGSDYLIINNLLWGNKVGVENSVKILDKEHRAMLQEALDGIREFSPDDFAEYKRRINGDAIPIAVGDIRNIMSAMRPSKNSMTVYRNVCMSNALVKCVIGDKILHKGFVSTSSVVHEKSFGKDPEFLRYDIFVPEGTPCIHVDADYRKEHEIILPQCVLEVTGLHKKIINLKYLSQLDIDELVKTWC